MSCEPAPWLASTPWRARGSCREWTDTDDIALAEWLQLRGLNAKPTHLRGGCPALRRDAPDPSAARSSRRPAWDGQARLDQWLITYLGVADSPYARAVGRAWMVQAVARVYRPGCKADHALILEGPQGAFKSTACAVIGHRRPTLFADEIADLGARTARRTCAGSGSSRSAS